jgi:diketogulonate reductase-like aldo/keto reductase
VLDKLAKARGEEVTQNQVLLKWLQSQGVIAVTTSSKESRVKEYLAAQSLPELTDVELKAIADAVADGHFRAFVSHFLTVGTGTLLNDHKTEQNFGYMDQN